MKYAVIKTGGKQYKVHEGDTLDVELLEPNASSDVVFDQVLLVAGDGQVQIGTPTVSGAVVTGTLQGEVRGPKIRVMKFKSKVRTRRATGHRQKYSQVLIKTIGTGKSQSLSEMKEIQPVKRAARKKSE
jgi:large subunit ribosomal protein L21